MKPAKLADRLRSAQSTNGVTEWIQWPDDTGRIRHRDLHISSTQQLHPEVNERTNPQRNDDRSRCHRQAGPCPVALTATTDNNFLRWLPLLVGLLGKKYDGQRSSSSRKRRLNFCFVIPASH